MNVVETLAHIEETLSALAHELMEGKRLDDASDTLDVAIQVHRLRYKIGR